MRNERRASLGLLLCAGMAGASLGALLGLAAFNDHIFAPALTMVVGAVAGVAAAILTRGAPQLPSVRPELRPVVRRRRAIGLRRVPAVRISAAARRPGAGVMTLPAHPSRVPAERVDPIGHLLSERVRRASQPGAGESSFGSVSGTQPAPTLRARPPAPDAIDVNAAGIDDLARLPGVGPAAAGRIMAHRKAHGPFASLQDLADVERFTIERVARLAPRAAVTAPAADLPALPDAESEPRSCPVCGDELTSPRAKYCSPSCRQAAYRKRRREQRTPAAV